MVDNYRNSILLSLIIYSKIVYSKINANIWCNENANELGMGLRPQFSWNDMINATEKKTAAIRIST